MLSDADQPRRSFALPSRCPLLPHDTYYSFLLDAFPGRLMDLLVDATSANLAYRRQRVTSKNEMPRVIGALLGVAHCGLSIRECWGDEHQDSTSEAEHSGTDVECGGQQGRQRQQEQQQQTPGAAKQSRTRNSTLHAVEPAIKAFNESRGQFEASNIIVMDEPMSRFITEVQHTDLMFLPRKPEAVADGESGVMLWLGIQRSSVPDKDKGCSWARRAAEKYFGTGRVLVGDPRLCFRGNSL